ncbi:MAG: extracellular solute-binding protein [Firmicutes bacterium]|nr:extracellular solute-binding protein [Bacillota bacterium]
MKKICVCIVLPVLIAAVLFVHPSKAQSNPVLQSDEFYEDSYKKYLEENDYTSMVGHDVEVVVPLDAFKASPRTEAAFTEEGLMTSDRCKVTLDFNVAVSGFYNLEIVYLPVKGTNTKIERKILIDHEVLHKGLEQISFNRTWADKDNRMLNIKGNEIRSSAEELFLERKVFVKDSKRRTSAPYKFYLEQGRHTITFESVKEPVLLKKVSFKTAKEVKNYQEVLEKEYKTYPSYDGENIVCQAERTDGNTHFIRKSSPGVGAHVNYSSPNTIPYHPYLIKLNTIGGKNWRIPGDEIIWGVNVPEAGLYQLSFRGRQSTNRGILSFRELKINGEVPFKEAREIGFSYSVDFQNYILKGEDGPYLLYFKEGINTIGMETVLGAFGRSLTEVEQSVLVLNDLYRKTIQITGLVPDRFIDYEITKKIPAFSQTLQHESSRLFGVAEELIGLTGEKGESTVIIEKMAIQAARLAQNPDDVILELSAFKSNISALGTWIMKISEMPLEIDSFTLSKTNAALPEPEPNFFVKAYYGLVRLISTFFVDNTKIITEEEQVQGDAVKVWISTGRDQAQVIRNLIDERFAAQNNIPIDLQLVPDNVVLPATLTGNGPDVVLSANQNMVLNFAIRNALVDVSTLEGFEDIRKRYNKSAFEAVTFRNRIYGIPEQQIFMMLFHRNDILAQLGIEIPKTWDDAKSIIPILHMNNYDFFIPTVQLYPTLVFQNGGDLYAGKGLDYGISSGLSDRASMEAFQQLTAFFTSYKLPVSADFSNRFRTGEMPIGIAPYTTYNQLEIFAPEIRGLWSFSPLLGVMDESGNLNNACVAETQQTIILKNTDNGARAWEFVKWWSSTEIQVIYANTLEAIMGSAARYATANKEALVQLPWSARNAEQILAQMENTKGVPEVPGGYMTTRMVDYAFKSVVTSGDNPRSALYLNIKEIDKELSKKRKEFNISYIER